MSRITAPLLSFGASGQIAKTQVYSTWKGRPYVRRYAIPSNPRTTDQTLTRDTFKWLNAVWRFMPSTAVSAWTAYGNASRFTNRNGFIKANLSNLRSASALTDFVFSPAAAGGLAVGAAVATAGANQISVAITAPSLPTGWTVASAVAACIRNQDPQTGVLYNVTAVEDVSSPYVCVLTGLTTGQLYQVGAWMTFNKPDGSIAYGQSLALTATPT